MKITIEYDSCWRNSFLDGCNNEPLPKKGRDFIGSMTNLKSKGNFIKREVTLDTVMGILNRLIGDQRKLYQSRQSDSYFFKGIESKVTFLESSKVRPTNEVVYLRNIKGNTDQNSFSGILKTEDPMFNSDYSQEFWSVMWMSWEQLCLFIVGQPEVVEKNELDPLSLCARFEEAGKLKPVEVEGVAEQALQVLQEHFPDENYLNNKKLILPGAFYCSSLYLQLQRLSDRYDLSTAKTKVGGISGVSKRTFTKKDFMKKFTTGKGKLIFGNPYLLKERIKGEGEVTSMLTKASGLLEITIDVDTAKGEEIQRQIENAGVSAFYFGKKGLAYVSSIDPRQTRKNHAALF